MQSQPLPWWFDLCIDTATNQYFPLRKRNHVPFIVTGKQVEPQQLRTSSRQNDWLADPITVKNAAFSLFFYFFFSFGFKLSSHAQQTTFFPSGIHRLTIKNGCSQTSCINVNIPDGKRKSKHKRHQPPWNLWCSHIWMIMRSPEGLEEPDRTSKEQDSSNIETNDLSTSLTWWARGVPGETKACLHRTQRGKDARGRGEKLDQTQGWMGPVIVSFLPDKDDESLDGEFNQTPRKSTHTGGAATHL